MKNVSLTIEDGDIYGIIGFSGAGKSTLIRNNQCTWGSDIRKGLVDGEDINALKQYKASSKRGKKIRKW